MPLDRPEQAETIDDVVRYEIHGRVVRSGMVAVVVPLTALHVLGQDSRHIGGLAVAGYEVRDVITDHPAEPAQLVPLMSKVVAYIGRGGHANREVFRLPARGAGRSVDGLDRPTGDVGVGELDDEAIGPFSDDL